MFAISKTVSQIPRCTYRLTDNVVGLATEITRNPIQKSQKQKSQKQKKPEQRSLHALQNELFGLAIVDFAAQPCPPELVDFQGFMFKNRQQQTRLEKDEIRYRQIQLIRSS